MLSGGSLEGQENSMSTLDATACVCLFCDRVLGSPDDCVLPCSSARLQTSGDPLGSVCKTRSSSVQACATTLGSALFKRQVLDM